MKCKLIAQMLMVRRLIRRFLHWLRHILARVRGQKSRHRHSVSSQQPQLLPYREQPLSQQAASQQTLPTSQPPASVDTSAPVSLQDSQPMPLPNAAANRAANSSRFKVLLSDYEYSPSPAVQSLSQQLSRPIPPSSPIKPLPKSILDTAKITAHPTRQESTQQTSSHIANSTEDKKDHISQIEETTLNLSSIDSKLPPKGETAITKPQQARSTVVADVAQLSSDQIPQPGHHNPRPIPKTPPPPTGVITKQGIVKLLFKLKKNNHHGYVAPNDGSKDIIFHKKYIGDDVFAQLERGMAVEVTAHITEGKAYADHIRIL